MAAAIKSAERTRELQAERAEATRKATEVIDFTLSKVRKGRSVLVSFDRACSQEIYNAANELEDEFIVVRNRAQRWFRIYIKSKEGL